MSEGQGALERRLYYGGENKMNKMQLEQCIKDYGKEIYAFCCQITPNTQEAEDLYQDTFLKAVEFGNRIDYEQNPKSYLVSIALRIWKNRKRKYAWRNRIAGTEQLVEEMVDGEDTVSGSTTNPVEEEILGKELKKQVQIAVAGLHEKYRVPVYMYYTLQLSIAQISSIMKLPPSTIKNRLFKARKLLQKELEVVLDET